MKKIALMIFQILCMVGFLKILIAQGFAQVNHASAFADPKGSIRISIFDRLALPIFSGNDFKTTVAHSILLTPTPFHMRYQLSDRFAIESHPAGWLLLGGPNAHLVHHFYRKDRLAIATKYGFSIPSWSLNMPVPFGLNGFFAPSCKVSQAESNRPNTECQNHGWAIAPQLTLMGSYAFDSALLTLQADLAVGLMLSGERRLPLGQLAPTSVLFAPLSQSYRSHLQVKYEHRFSEKLRAIGEAEIYRVGDDQITSPWYFASHLAMLYWLSQKHLLSLGLSYWNYDQHAMKWANSEKINGVQYQKKVHVRSQDLYPFIDFMFYF